MMMYPAAFTLTLLPPAYLNKPVKSFPVENIPGGVSAADGGQRPAVAPKDAEGPMP